MECISLNVGFYGTGTLNLTGGGKAIATTTVSLGSTWDPTAMNITGAGSSLQAGQPLPSSDSGVSLSRYQ